MEKIILEVPDRTAQKWQEASPKLKQRAARMVGRLLAKPEHVGPAPTEEENRKIQVQQAQKFFSELSADFTNYKFDRDEANERGLSDADMDQLLNESP